MSVFKTCKVCGESKHRTEINTITNKCNKCGRITNMENQKTFNDVMIDLETLGTDADSVITQIGACYFDRKTGEIGATMQLDLDWQDSINQGRKINADTLVWWMSQSEEARESFTKSKGKGESLHTSLDLLGQFIRFNGNKETKVWGNGSTFDISMLENAYASTKSNPPWKFWNVRDCRTVQEISTFNRSEIPREGTHHNALSDAIYQAKYISAMLQEIKNRNK